MPFCPKCRYEYKQGIEICPDCDEKLVHSLSPDANSDKTDLHDLYDDWVQLARFTSPQYAEMLVEGLKAKNIPAVIISGTGHFGQTGQLGTSTFRPVGGAYSMIVPREFVEDADREAELMLGDEWEKARLVDLG
jgi:hypothetical protein